MTFSIDFNTFSILSSLSLMTYFASSGTNEEFELVSMSIGSNSMSIVSSLTLLFRFGKSKSLVKSSISLNKSFA